MKIVYIIGQPGSGKSTLMKAWLAQHQFVAQNKEPFKHETYTHGTTHIYSLGIQKNQPFGGTDTLPNTVITKVIDWIPTLPADSIIIGEGDRLANQRFFDFCKDQTTEFILVWLNTPNELASQRREERATRLQKTLQNPSWIKGRITKSTNLANTNNHIVIDGSTDLDSQLRTLTNAIGL